jgi:putative peptidoglycan lipid II flippase
MLRILGFLREVVLAATYGAGVVSDAFVIAMTLPGIVLAVIAGAINTLYIPQYNNIEGDKSNFTNTLLTLLFIAGLIFSITLSLFPETLVYIFASNIAPDAFRLATTFLQIMVWSAIPLLLTGIFRSYLQMKSMFFMAMISDALVNIFVISFILASNYSRNLILLGIGSVIGNVASMSVLMLLSRRNGLKYRPRLDLNDEHVKMLFRLTLPLLLTTAVSEINQIVDKNLASSLVSGTVSSLSYAGKINAVIISLIGGSMGIALFPKASELAASGDIDRLKRQFIMCFKNLFPLLLPMTVGMFLMAQPIIRILLERGAFEPEDTRRTAECLQMYTLGIIAANFNNLVTRVFHALRQTKWPAVMSAISITVGIILNLLFIKTMQHRGLALATSISTTLCFVLMLITLRKRIGLLGMRSQLPEFAKITTASLIMGALVWFAMRLFAVMNSNYINGLIKSLLIAGGGALIYFIILAVLRVEWIWNIAAYIKKFSQRRF